MLKHNASKVITDIQNMEELTQIAQCVELCYERAYGKKVGLTPNKLAQEAFEKTGVLKAGENIQAMIGILDAAQ